MSFEHLKVYQAAELLDAEINNLIAGIPRGHSKDIDELRRAVGSVLFNIPEAYGLEQPGKKRNHLEIARGSADEARAVLRRFVNNNVLTEKATRRARTLTQAIAKMLTSWIASLPHE
jgi:four helix bundle protein